jgi:DNA-binding beta-propeller fold protein YncE
MKFTRHATGTLSFGIQAVGVTAAVTSVSDPVARRRPAMTLAADHAMVGGRQRRRVKGSLMNGIAGSTNMKRRARLIILGLAAWPLAGCGPNSPAPAAAGPFVYAVNTKSNEISQYSASPSRFGTLKPLAPATVPTGPFPYGIAIDPHGNSVYVADVNVNEVSQYTINPMTGQLTPKTPATVAGGRGSVEVAVTPNGERAYVVNRNAISQYSINPATGN